jgi:homoserine O-acetyltransferase/O-succinyltransferase
MMEEKSWPDLRQGEFKIPGFQFASGETLDELTLRYMTLGRPQRDRHDNITNAVLLIHNTTGSGRTWLQPSLADELFGEGQALDLRENFIVIPDMIGFGGSSKPSDGMRARFPHYRYDDMVVSTHRLLTECLGIGRLKLLLGISMGGMLAWIYGAKYPDFVERLVPVASQPGPMSGRNWIQRRVSIEAIRNDPEWNNGDYETNPTRYVLTAPFSGLLIQSVVRLQEKAPTREAGDALYQTLVERAKKGDANNRLYQVEASMDYDPSGDLDKIKARLLAINFEDDELNPPQLGTVEPAIEKIPGAQYVMVPAGADTNGHYSTMLAHLWAPHLKKFLAGTPIS